jgi:putative ATP-dependent endonuclease of OLD family
MKFKSISIKNFRNYKDIAIELNNKNVFFGMNDVGKTNFLYALRYVFDKDVRKTNFVDTDFYRKDITEPIEIMVAIDISDIGDPDSDKLRARVKGAILSTQDIVYIKLIARYEKAEMCANPILYWGGDSEKLREIKAKGNAFEIDYVFNVIYIDAYVNLYSLFKKNTAVLLKNNDEADKVKLDDIQHTVEHLNSSISSLSGIKKFEERVSPEYHGFRHDNVEISIRSEIAVNGLYSNVSPYIKSDDSEVLYPTSGEGRKKLLVYSIYDLLAEESSQKKLICS